MAFVNERVSEKDVKKYGIDVLWNSYGIGRTSEKLPGFYYPWTIDRDRDIYLICVDSGREEYSNRLIFVLGWLKSRIEIELDYFGDGHRLLGDQRPATSTWKMVRLSPPEDFPRNNTEIIEVLKEALKAYKISGISWPIDMHTAIFLNFDRES